MICSLIPTEKLPRPSNDLGEMPLKSRTRGSARFTKRSKNSYMRSRRSGTMQPIFWPWRSLQVAIDFLAFCFFSLGSLPSASPLAALPFLTTSGSTRSRSGLTSAAAGLALAAGAAPSGVFFSSAMFSSLRRLELRLALHADAQLLSVFVQPPGPPGRIALSAPEPHVGGVNRSFFLDDAALRVLLARLDVALDHVDPLDHDAVLLGQKPHDLAALALFAAGHHHHLVALANVSERHHSTSGASEMIFMNRR